MVKILCTVTPGMCITYVLLTVKCVQFCFSSLFGLKVIGHSNFSSIRATTCVYKGNISITIMYQFHAILEVPWSKCKINYCTLVPSRFFFFFLLFLIGFREMGLWSSHLISRPNANRMVHTELQIQPRGTSLHL